jgi:hypothetical protein
LPETDDICHCEAPCVSSAFGSEKTEDCSVGVRVMPVAALAGKALLGLLGDRFDEVDVLKVI